MKLIAIGLTLLSFDARIAGAPIRLHQDTLLSVTARW